MGANKRCDQCRYSLRNWLYLLESWAAWMPFALIAERWYWPAFRGTAFLDPARQQGWRFAIAAWLAQSYYGAGRHWPSRCERRSCTCQHPAPQPANQQVT